MKRIALALMISLSLLSCSKEKENLLTSTVNDTNLQNLQYRPSRPNGRHQDKFIDDQDGQSYTYRVIGGQTWMTQNLNYSGNGSFYNNDSINKKYGRLYSQVEAYMNIPAGWHLPSVSEWDSLLVYYKDSIPSLLDPTKFNCLLGGFNCVGPSTGLGTLCAFWAASTSPGYTEELVMINTNSNSISIVGINAQQCYCRYVKD